MSPRVRLALFLSGILLLSQAFRLPSDVWDVAAHEWAKGFHFTYPNAYVFLAPFCGLADMLTVLGLHASFALFGWIALFVALSRTFKRALILIIGFFLLVAWGALCPRPMAKLHADNPDHLLIDFHSHSRVSHDGRPSFTARANMEWHRAQGYNAAFITDHNRIESSVEAKHISFNEWPVSGYASLEGEEISLQKTHLVVLGAHERIDNRPYDSDLKKIPSFIKDMHKKGLLVIASLPEYWFYHWGQGVEDFIRWGIDGFEVINSAPTALDFPRPYLDRVLDLCSTHNLFITGISDNHGYGYATAAWNVLNLSGWNKLGANELEKSVITKLKNDRFKAVQVLARPRYSPKFPWQAIFGPLVGLLILWRSLTPLLVLSWIAWIWIVTFLYSSFILRGTQRSGVGSSRVDLQACKLEYSIVSPK